MLADLLRKSETYMAAYLIGFLKKALPLSVIRKLAGGARKYWKHRYYRLAKGQIALVKSLSDSPFKKRPREGFMRGIDYYNGNELTAAVAVSMEVFRSAHGVLPNLIEPKGFNEKIVWSKFFTEMKIPESGNKLLTSKFIPQDIRHLVRCPKICWHSTFPTLPANNQLPPGYYYLKANHGSAMFRRIRYPLSDEELVDLQSTCQRWLENSFGVHDGEWWYNVFPKEVLLEVDVALRDGSPSYEFFVLSGEIGLIQIRRKRIPELGLEAQLTRFDANFNMLPAPLQDGPRVQDVPNLTDDTRRKMKICATRIGGQFRFARVDFLLDDNQSVYLGEVTFSPVNALAPRPRAIDVALGEKWVLQ